MKPFIILSLLLTFGFSVFAQKRPFNAQIEQQKIAYVQQKLELSKKESTLFWPIYKQWQDKENELRKNRSDHFLKYSSEEEINAMSDAQINNRINGEILFKARITQLERVYLTKIRAVIPPKKVVALFKAQEAFKRDLLRQYHKGNQKH